MVKQVNGYLHFASDIDGPIFVDLTGAFFEWVNRTMGLNWDYRTYALTGDWDKASPGYDHLGRNRLYAAFRNSDSFCTDRPTAGAREALTSLPKSRRSLVTLRTKETREMTTNALRNVGEFDQLFFSIPHKFRVLRELGAQLYVEDSVRESRRAAHALPNIKVVLFPTRGVQRLNVKHPRIIIPQSEHWNTAGISDQQWEDVCRSAWQETVEVAHSLASCA